MIKWAIILPAILKERDLMADLMADMLWLGHSPGAPSNKFISTEASFSMIKEKNSVERLPMSIPSSPSNLTYCTGNCESFPDTIYAYLQKRNSRFTTSLFKEHHPILNNILPVNGQFHYVFLVKHSLTMYGKDCFKSNVISILHIS